MGSISLTIDGRTVEVEAGKTVLEAARVAGITIPTICDHKDLNPYGSCRMCIVEIEGVRGYPTSCTTPAAEGMQVKTQSARLTTLQYYEEEYRAHIEDHKCPAGACRALIRFEIDPARCTGCMACARACPVEAISGEKKKPHLIDQERCIQCGSCRQACKFEAVLVS